MYKFCALKNANLFGGRSHRFCLAMFCVFKDIYEVLHSMKALSESWTSPGVSAFTDNYKALIFNLGLALRNIQWCEMGTILQNSKCGEQFNLYVCNVQFSAICMQVRCDALFMKSHQKDGRMCM